MIHVVSFSSGLSSALAVERVLARYGDDEIAIVFMDTRIEDEDNYRFLDDMRRRWARPVTVLADGRTPYQLFRDQNIVPNHRVAPCTHRLKIEPFTRYLADLTPPVTVHIGYDFSEVHRCQATRDNYERRGYLVDFPLLWKPLEFRPYVQVCREDWGIEPPRMYGLGYSHANCGGRCVKQGIGDWLRTLAHFPERYAEVEAWEANMRQNDIHRDYAILRDRSREGNGRALTLAELRERHANDAPTLFAVDDVGCIRCGIGDYAPGRE